MNDYLNQRKKDLEDWFYGDIHLLFKNRIIAIDDHVAKDWAILSTGLHRKGICVDVQDLYIATTAKTKGFALVTLNTTDFQFLDIQLINP